jgi:spore maturation protein CgeB
VRVLLRFRNRFPGLREGFEALGHEVIEADGPADLCVMDFVDAARRIRETRALRKRTPLILWSRDAPWHRGINRRRLFFMRLLRPFDAYAAHSMQGAQAFGPRTLYCANAARESVYNVSTERLAAMRDPAAFQWDVSFVGNLDVQRYPEHARRAAFLAALKDRLGGLKVHFGGGDDVELVRTSRINLSVLAACDAGPEKSWGLPERCYGVPASGGFLLSDRRQHAAHDFDPAEWADFEGLEECVARIRHFLAHPDEARAIAERAHARVQREHLYRHRAARLIDFAADAR